LRRQAWLSASELFAAGPQSSSHSIREKAAIFYAESWALADMLISSQRYAPRLNDLVRMVNAGAASEQAIAKVYGQTADAIIGDARTWIGHPAPRQVFPLLGPEESPETVKELSTAQARAMLADLLFTGGDSDRAERIYQEVLHESPGDPEILASLGTVALRKGDRRMAGEYWRKALDCGLADAGLCYRYALLADDMNLPSRDVERALERAIAINQNFDDARFKLALLKSNSGEYSDAVSQLQSMATPAPARAFAYWAALAYALSELGRREEAQNAAEHAMHVAANPEQRGRAAELSYMAKTDLNVRFARDASGKLQLVTTRVPHGTTDFNPFIESGDRIQTATGTLREVQCSGGRLTGFLVESKTGLLTLSVPDPTHVLMRNAPSEFTCGPQVPKSVKVEYATADKPSAGILRGMAFQ
jgi:Flp pilus assembly protein TadD